MANKNIGIVGLGNPGREYENTRHNIGKTIVSQLTDIPSGVHIFETRSYMNTIGQDVAKNMSYYKIEPKDLWVIYDDLDLPVGTLRIRFGGSSGGHKGVESIIESLGSNDFWRFRIGIDHPKESLPVTNHVLEKFSLNEEKSIQSIIDQTKEYVVEFISTGKPEEHTLTI